MQSLRLPLLHSLHRTTTSLLNPKIPFLQIRNQTTQKPTKNDAVTHEFRFFRVYESGRVEKFHQTHKTPPSSNPITGVKSKDVIISTDPPISARIFLPRIPNPTLTKLPVLLHVHGGGFSFESAFSPHIDSYVSTLSSAADVIAVSVEYRLAPENPIPACYDDSWAALNWVASHCSRNGPEQWLNDHADFDHVFVAGDSAGGNITHDLIFRVGWLGLPGVKIIGAVLVHPFFGGTEDDGMWHFMCGENERLQDRRLRPGVEDLRRIGCGRVLVFVAGEDHLNGVGRRYVEELKMSGWDGVVEIVEDEGEDHCFHIGDRKSEKAKGLISRFAEFIKQV